MNTQTRFCYTIFLAFALGCGESSFEDGAEGGACRLTEMPCDGDLICTAGKCVPNSNTALPELTIAAELSTRAIVANGEDEIELQILVNIVEDNAPFTGELLLYTEPSGVGQLSASLVTIEDGFGVETYRSCNRRNDPICPEVMSFKLAYPSAPSSAIFESETFRQTSTAITSATRLNADACRQLEGSQVAITLPGLPNELIEDSMDNPLSADTRQLQISTAALDLTLPLPGEGVDRYQALSPDMVSVTFDPTSASLMPTADEDTAITSSCLSNGTWVGSQTVEYFSEENDEGTSMNHVLSTIELDCYDDRGGYAVIRACAHGTN
ncbi:MAG: hypothetical protein ACPGQS_08155 [Bradymonadia bacterium]